jgi:DNA repair exonuclease SbcCD ATPase subunit
MSEEKEIDELLIGEVSSRIKKIEEKLSELEKNSLPKVIYEGLIKEAGTKINKLIDGFKELELLVKNKPTGIQLRDRIKELEKWKHDHLDIMHMDILRKWFERHSKQIEELEKKIEESHNNLTENQLKHTLQIAEILEQIEELESVLKKIVKWESTPEICLTKEELR